MFTFTQPTPNDLDVDLDFDQLMEVKIIDVSHRSRSIFYTLLIKHSNFMCTILILLYAESCKFTFRAKQDLLFTVWCFRYKTRSIIISFHMGLRLFAQRKIEPKPMCQVFIVSFTDIISYADEYYFLQM